MIQISTSERHNHSQDNLNKRSYIGGASNTFTNTKFLQLIIIISVRNAFLIIVSSVIMSL